MTWHIPSNLPCTVDESGTSTWVLVPHREHIVRLDTVSSLIWQAANGASDLEDVLRRLRQRHGWDEEDIRTHVEAFVADLQTHGLLTMEK